MYAGIRLVVKDKAGNVVMNRNIQDMPVIYEGYQVTLEASPAYFVNGDPYVVLGKGQKPITSPAFVTESYVLGTPKTNKS
jgi:hypothetical protein